MSEVLLIGLKSSIKYIALLSAIIATLGYRKYSMGKAKYFLFAIWFIALTEFSYKIVYYQILKEQHKVFFIANLHFLIIGSFYLLWFRFLIKDRKKRQAILFMFLTLMLFFIINSMFIEPFLEIQNYTFGVAAIFVILTILLFFIEILNTEKILQFERSVYFWFSLGILIFWAPFIPLWFTNEYFGFLGPTYVISIFVLNLLMHLFFIIGILWSKRKFNY